MRSTALALLLLAVAAPAHAQPSDGQLWTSASAKTGLSDELDLSVEFVARFSSEADGLSELQYQADLGLEVRKDVRIGIGYSYVPRYDEGDLITREHRIRQQVTAKLGKLAGGTVEGRLRLEQRWRDDGEDTLFRLRPRLSWTRHIGPSDLAVRLTHESFILLNDTDWGGEAGYNRMRNQLSLRRAFGRVVTGEIGYLNQYDFAPGERDAMAHALTLAVGLHF